jgi:hypothetical protein
MTDILTDRHATRGEWPARRDTATCAVPTSRAHQATDGRLCRDHLEELAAWLRDVETEARRLTIDPDDPEAWAALPPLETRWDRGGGSLASQQSPVVLDAIVQSDPRTTIHGWRHLGPVCDRCAALADRRCICPPLPWRRQTHYRGCLRCGVHPSCVAILADRDEFDAHAERLTSVVAVLNGWADHVRQGCRLSRPVEERFLRFRTGPQHVPCPARCAHTSCAAVGVWVTAPVPPTVRSERLVLSRHLDWAARQPWIAAFRRELADLRAQLLRVNHNCDDRPLPGRCFRLVDGAECGGDLWPTEPLHSSGYETSDGTRAVVCGRNDTHRWEGPQLVYLALIVAQQREDPTP